MTQGHDMQSQVSPTLAEGPSAWKANLDKHDLELGWYQKHTPLKPSYSLTERPGYLRLWGNCYDLSSPEAPAMLLRKQTAYFQTFEVTLEFDPRRVGYEAGIVLWWNHFSYATMGVTFVAPANGKEARTVVARNATGQAGVMRTTYPLSSRQGSPETLQLSLLPQPVKLLIICQGSKYFLVLEQLGIEQARITCSAGDLTVLPPVGGAFAGVLYGIYAFGRGEPVLDPADFTAIGVVSENTNRK